MRRLPRPGSQRSLLGGASGSASARPLALATLLCLSAGEPLLARTVLPGPLEWAVGETRTFQIHSFLSGADEAVDCRLEAEGSRSFLWVAIDQLDSTKVTPEQISALLVGVESETPEGSLDPEKGILEIEQSVFGAPPDVDGSGRVHLVVADLQDGWSPDCACPYTAGFFNPNDLDVNLPGSNGADIIYLDAYPTLYDAQGSNLAAQALNTLAHEYQHLLHANGGDLNPFQNEGQSEWATELVGYGVRTPTYLSMAAQLQATLMLWRGGENTAYDYQRAGLLHSYLAERVGVATLGSLSQSGYNGTIAYDNLFGDSLTTWAETLVRFHLANRVNDTSLDPAYGYASPARARVRATASTLEVPTGSSLAATPRAVAYGAVDYVEWAWVRDLTLTLTPLVGGTFYAVQIGEDGTRSVSPVSSGSSTWPGRYASFTLVAVNQTPSALGDQDDTPASYTVAAAWTPLEVEEETLSYADPGQVDFLTTLPFGNATGISVRFTPYVTGLLSRLDLQLTSWLDGSPNPAGDGLLRVGLAEDSYVAGGGSEAIYAPGTELAFLEIPLTELGSGANAIDLGDAQWAVLAGESFHLTFEVVSPDQSGAVTFDLDSGASDRANPHYYPARTRRDTDHSYTWEGTFVNNGNVLVGLSIVGTVDAVPAIPVARSPANGSAGYLNPLGLFWYPSGGATGYDLELASEPGFSAPLVSKRNQTATEEVLPPLALGSAWYWRARASNSRGSSAWSAVRTFVMAGEVEGMQELAYHTDALPWIVTLPFETETRWAVRFSPTLTGYVRAIRLDLTRWSDGSPNPVGTGSLRLSLAESVPPEQPDLYGIYAPGEILASLEVPLSTLTSGPNTLELQDPAWSVLAGEDVHLVLEVLDPAGRSSLSLNLDDGSPDPWNQDYTPARTLREFGSGAWSGTFLDNGNLALGMSLRDTLEDETPTPEPTEPPEPTTTPDPTDPPVTPEPTSTPPPTHGPHQSPTPDGGGVGGGGCTCASSASGPSRLPLASLLLLALGLWAPRRSRA